MTAPTPVTLPASGATTWYAHYQWLDATARYLGATIEPALTGKLDTSRVGQVNGVASLDAAGRLPQGQLPQVVLTNFATLADAQTAGANGQLVTGQIITIG